MEVNIWSIRFKSLGYSLLGYLLSALALFLGSEAFGGFLSEVVTNPLLYSLITMGITEAIKHLRNIKVVQTATLGSITHDRPMPVDLI